MQGLVSCFRIGLFFVWMVLGGAANALSGVPKDINDDESQKGDIPVNVSGMFLTSTSPCVSARLVNRTNGPVTVYFRGGRSRCTLPPRHARTFLLGVTGRVETRVGVAQRFGIRYFRLTPGSTHGLYPGLSGPYCQIERR